MHQTKINPDLIIGSREIWQGVVGKQDPQGFVWRLRCHPLPGGRGRCPAYAYELGPQSYTPPPGWGLEKIGKWLVWTIWWCIYKLLYFTAVCITTKRSTPAIALFFLGPNPVVVYIFGVPTRASHFLCNATNLRNAGKLVIPINPLRALVGLGALINHRKI